MMKSLLNLTAAMLMSIPAVTVARQPHYVLEGTVNHLSAPATMYLRHYKDKVLRMDSTILTDGHYRFEGDYDPDEQTYMGLSLSGKGWHSVRRAREVYLEKGGMEVNSTDSFMSVSYVHSPINAAFQDLGDSMMTAYNRYGNTDTAALNRERQRLSVGFIARFPASPISLTIVKEYGLFWQDDAAAEPLFDQLSPQVKESPSGKAYAEKIAEAKAVTIGQVLPDFTLPDTLGKAISLHDFRGKYVLVDFWASWCGPCRAENPNVVSAYNKYKANGFTVLGVSLDYPGARNAWLKAIHDDHLPWTQLSDLQGWKSAPVQLFAIGAIPRNFLLDPDGKVIAQNLRGDALDNTLRMVLKK